MILGHPRLPPEWSLMNHSCTQNDSWWSPVAPKMILGDPQWPLEQRFTRWSVVKAEVFQTVCNTKSIWKRKPSAQRTTVLLTMLESKLNVLLRIPKSPDRRIPESTNLRIPESPNFRIAGSWFPESPIHRIPESPNSRITGFPNTRIPESPVHWIPESLNSSMICLCHILKALIILLGCHGLSTGSPSGLMIGGTDPES